MYNIDPRCSNAVKVGGQRLPDVHHQTYAGNIHPDADAKEEDLSIFILLCNPALYSDERINLYLAAFANRYVHVQRLS